MFEAVFGTIVGILWGYCRKLDWFFTEMYNIFDNIPQTLVLILFSYIMRPGVGTIIFALCLTGWLETARFIRNLPTDIPSLGNLVSDGFALMSQPDMRYQLLFPTALLSIITISFYVIGNAFADAADPKNHV